MVEIPGRPFHRGTCAVHGVQTETKNRTQVDEASVLSESAGLHMGAGPYMLFYSRASDEAASAPPAASADWPESIAVSVPVILRRSSDLYGSPKLSSGAEIC